jgi:two-component system OmpR family response regulator
MMTTQSILICDDDPLLLELLEYRLASKGYRVTIARDGGEALELARNSAPDAIVLDAMMPVIDGYEVLRRIRNDENMGSIPVLMLTARKQERDVLSALELGASDFMVKPFIPEELAARLARLLAGQRK